MERDISRRDRPPSYFVEYVPAAQLSKHVRTAPADPAAHLVAAGRMTSCLRRALRANGIDPRMARFVLCFYGRSKTRVRDIAFAAAVSAATASRWLDRAEALGLADKFYDERIDRRATSARLTKRGRALRTRVEQLLTAAAPYAPTHFGAAFGARHAPPLGPDL